MKELIRLIDVSTNTDNFADLNHLFLTIFCGQVHYLAGLHGSGKAPCAMSCADSFPQQQAPLPLTELLFCPIPRRMPGPKVFSQLNRMPLP